MKKTLALLVLSALFLTGCGDCINGNKNRTQVEPTPEPTPTPRFEKISEQGMSTKLPYNNPGFLVIRDTQTGEEYLVTQDGHGTTVIRLTATGHNATK